MAARCEGRPDDEAAPRRREVNVDVAPVAQLDRALEYGSKGWGFDSSRAHHGTKPASPSEGRSEAAAPAASRRGGVPKLPNGAECKSAAVCIRRTEPYHHHWAAI